MNSPWLRLVLRDAHPVRFRRSLRRGGGLSGGNCGPAREGRGPHRPVRKDRGYRDRSDEGRRSPPDARTGASRNPRAALRRAAPQQDRQLHLGHSPGPASVVGRVLPDLRDRSHHAATAWRRSAPVFIRTTCNLFNAETRAQAGRQGRRFQLPHRHSGKEA